MKLKRIVALGAVVLGSLTIPTTALASTASSPPRPIAVQVGCPPVRLMPTPSGSASAVVNPAKAVPVEAVPAKAVQVESVYPVRVALCCGAVKRGNKVVHRVCPPSAVVFDMPAWGRTLTEMSGPRLFVHETLLYRGGLYTVTSVRGGKFTLDLRDQPFVNRGPAIRDGRAFILRDVAVFLCAPRPSK